MRWQSVQIKTKKSKKGRAVELFQIGSFFYYKDVLQVVRGSTRVNGDLALVSKSIV